MFGGLTPSIYALNQNAAELKPGLKGSEKFNHNWNNLKDSRYDFWRSAYGLLLRITCIVIDVEITD